MTTEEAIKKYIEKFGGFPYFLFMGADENYLVKKIEIALQTGKEIEPEKNSIY